MPNDSKFYFAGQSINDQSWLVTASPLQGPLLITINNGVKESLPPSLTALASLVPPNIRSVAQVLESRTKCQVVPSQALHAVPLQTKQPSGQLPQHTVMVQIFPIDCNYSLYAAQGDGLARLESRFAEYMALLALQEMSV